MKTSRRRALAALAAAALVLPLAAAAQAAPTSADAVRCGRISYTTRNTTQVFAVRVEQGKLACGPAKTVLRRFLTRAEFPKGWFCARGHASQKQRWAASCASTAGAVVKAYRVKPVTR